MKREPFQTRASMKRVKAVIIEINTICNSFESEKFTILWTSLDHLQSEPSTPKNQLKLIWIQKVKICNN